MKKVDKKSPLPLHFQIKDILKEMIENEELKPGEFIPPERELCEIQGVSRMTVNKAIMALVNEGLLYREQGKGTFVAHPKINQQLSQLKGFTAVMEEKGIKTTTKLLSFEIKSATKQLKKFLNLSSENSKIIEMHRLRFADEEPIAFEKVYVPHHLCPDMSEELLDGNSLYDILNNKYNYHFESATETIEPILINDYEASLLNQNSNALALIVNRTTTIGDGSIIEYANSIYRTDKYKYEIKLT